MYIESIETPATSADFGTDGFCTDQAASRATFYALQLVAVLVAVATNILVKVVTKKFARFERHHLASFREARTAFGIFVLQFFNTGLIVLIVFGQIDDVKTGIAETADSVSDQGGTTAVNDATSLFPLFSGPYPDLNPEWYTVVGTSLILTVLLNSMLPLVPVLLRPFKALARRCRTVSTQTELNLAVVGPVFEIAARYGLLMSTTFVCMLYSAGMPIMLLLVAFTFFVMFWVEKFLLLRVYRTPPQYGDGMAKMCMNVLPWAALMHLSLSLWIFSAGDTFPRPAVSSQVSEAADEFIASECGGNSTLATNTSLTVVSRECEFLTTFNVAERLFNYVTIHVFLFWLLLLLSLVFLRIIVPLLMIQKCSKGGVGAMEGLPSFKQVQASGDLQGIPDYELESNPEYVGLFAASSLQPKQEFETTPLAEATVSPPDATSPTSPTSLGPEQAV
mmetsp:Transcript_31926/g.68931  ORF Transcript_31926/g.68931 Transcript_31926/m.68931 type:complete len:449 (+) Transcript_31926:296-1642(+)